MAFVQARWVAQVLSGKAILPDQATMLRDMEAFYKLRASHGVPVRYTHCQVNCPPLCCIGASCRDVKHSKC